MRRELAGPLHTLRRRLLARLNETVHGEDLQLERYARPLGDRGLFGPDSVAWRVHGHPAGMFMGGIAALFLQSLHPLAMAAVDQHSDFRVDALGRLRRTAGFVTTTTFGSTAAAHASIAVVRRIHERVRGTAPDGRTYRADDPDLLTWVHVAEVSCFLAGYQTFAAEPLTPDECDRYFAETAQIAEALGAHEVPRSVGEMKRYLARMRPLLARTDAATESIRFLRKFGRTRQEHLAIVLLMNGAIGLLPGWARTELGLRRPAVVRATWDRPVARLLGGVFVWATKDSEIRAAARARAEHTDSTRT